MKDSLNEKIVKVLAFMLVFVCCVAGLGTTSYADETQEPSVVKTEGNIYALEDWADEFISMPASYQDSFQIQVSNATDISYCVISGSCVDVSDTGLVTPRVKTYYWYNADKYSYGTTTPIPDLECVRITNEISFGISVIRVTADGRNFDVTVEVCDYAEIYADEIIDDYIEKNISTDMTLEEKLKAICKMPASYNYSARYSGYLGMIISGGGDCWASTGLILEMCERLGIEAKERNGNRDAGAGSGHMNVLVIVGDGDYYELEAGYSGKAPRFYSVTHRNSLFCYRSEIGGIELYQYDGELEETTTLTIPKTIDSKKVVAMDGLLFSGADKLKKIIFEGDAPIFADNVFSEITANVYYPVGNSTWTKDVMQSYGGNITWVSYNRELNGLCKVDGTWGYYKEGILQTDYTGMAKNQYGWWYIKNGKLDTTYTGLVQYNKSWVYVSKGKLDATYTGLVKYKSLWVYVNKGKLDSTYTGMVKYKNSWVYVKKGKLDATYTGLGKNKYGWWHMTNGKLDLTYTGMSKNQYGWWYANKGKLDLTYTGLAKNQYGWWYVNKGKLDLTYTGKVKYNGAIFNVENGKVVK